MNRLLTLRSRSMKTEITAILDEILRWSIGNELNGGMDSK